MSDSSTNPESQPSRPDTVPLKKSMLTGPMHESPVEPVSKIPRPRIEIEHSTREERKSWTQDQYEEALANQGRVSLNEYDQRIQAERKGGKDLMTPLLNKIEFEKRLGQEVSRASRYGEELAVIMLDLDKFKDVNDDVGHETGDNVIRAVASYIDMIFQREYDIKARWGGDEFALIIPGLAKEQVMQTCHRLYESIKNAHISSADNNKETVEVGTTIGIAMLNKSNIQSILSQADTALRVGKYVRGRNTVLAFDEVTPEDLEELKKKQNNNPPLEPQTEQGVS